MVYKFIYLARRAADISRAEWPRTWKSHAIFASGFPALEASIGWLRYCNRIDTADFPGLSQDHDGVGIAGAETLEALNGTGFSPDDRALIDADELRVFDMLTRHFTWYCTESTVIDGPRGEVALFSFLARRPGHSADDFRARFSAHEGVAAAALSNHGKALRHAHNLPIGEPLPLFPFDGIAETWFADDASALAALADPDPALAPMSADRDSFCDPARSITVLTRTCHRWPRD